MDADEERYALVLSLLEASTSEKPYLSRRETLICDAFRGLLKEKKPHLLKQTSKMVRKSVTIEELMCYFASEKESELSVILTTDSEEQFYQSWKDISLFFQKHAALETLLLNRCSPEEACLVLPAKPNVSMGGDFGGIKSLRRCTLSILDDTTDSRHLKNWANVLISYLKTRQPSACPESVFSRFIDFVREFSFQTPLFRMPDVVHWCSEDESLEINYANDFVCLYVDAGGCSLFDEQNDQWYEDEQEVMAHLTKKISITCE